MSRLELKIPPPLVAIACGLLMWGLAGALPAAELTLPLLGLLAPICALLGLGLILASMLQFLRARTTIDPTRPAHAAQLVLSGCNRFSRNPMYLGALMLLLGWALWLGNLATLPGLPLFVLYLNRFQIGPEERFLTEKFGEQYLAYCARVRRWL